MLITGEAVYSLCNKYIILIKDVNRGSWVWSIYRNSLYYSFCLVNVRPVCNKKLLKMKMNYLTIRFTLLLRTSSLYRWLSPKYIANLFKPQFRTKRSVNRPLSSQNTCHTVHTLRKEKESKHYSEVTISFYTKF